MPGIVPTRGPLPVIHSNLFGRIKNIVGMLGCIFLKVDCEQVGTIAKGAVAQKRDIGWDGNIFQANAYQLFLTFFHFTSKDLCLAVAFGPLIALSMLICQHICSKFRVRCSILWVAAHRICSCIQNRARSPCVAPPMSCNIIS